MKTLTAYQKALATEAVGRAEAIADWYARRHPAGDEIRSAAQWATIRAASHYVPDTDRVWERWCNHNVRLDIRRALQAYKIRSAREQDGLSEETLSSPPSPTLDEIMECLPESCRELCRLIYESGLSATQAGIAMGRSGRWGRLTHQSSLERLREYHEPSDTNQSADPR